MTDTRIYGKQASQITDDVIRELETHVGNIGIFADVLREQIHEYITTHDRSDLTYKQVYEYADKLFWEDVHEAPMFVEAVEGSDECIEHVMESLGSTCKSDDFFERVRVLAEDYWSM